MRRISKSKRYLGFWLSFLMLISILGFYNPVVARADGYDSAVALSQNGTRASEGYFTDYEEACDYIREQLTARAETITFSVATEIVTALDSVYDFYDSAMAYYSGCESNEGDALTNEVGLGSTKVYSYGAYKTLETSVSYYTDAEKESELNALIKRTVSDMKISGKSDYQKVRSIFDYVCDHVNYDYEHLNDSTYLMKQTAYAAMIDGTAVCQGYAVLFYRMCIEAGVECRVITGWGNGVAHAWNIVKIGDYWYNIDSTWDGQDEGTTHNWFLLNQEDFLNHTRSSAFSSEKFLAEYPMASESWKDYSEAVELPNYSNLSEYNYHTINDEIITNQANGRPKVLIFFRNTCGNSQYTIKSICGNTPEGIDIIAINLDTETKESVIEFRDTYGNDNIEFVYAIDGYTYNSSHSFAYYRMFSTEDSYIIPLTVYIDADNHVQYYTTSAVSTSGLKRIVADYCSGGMIWKLDAEDSMEAGSTCRIKILLNNVEKNQQFFQWESTNPAVATVDANGTVSALENGLTVIQCKLGDVVLAQKEIRVKKSGVTGLQLIDGKWYYCVDGDVDTGFTGLIDKNGYSWYVKNGTIDMEYAGLFYYNDEWSFIRKGKVDTSRNGLVYNAGNWWYIKDGKLPTDFIGIVENENGKWYIRYGKLDSTRSGLVYINGVWWYLNNGKVNESFEGLLAYNNIWWYIKDGQIQTDYTGLVANDYGWWYVKAGKIDFTYTGIATNANGSWYVKAGKIDFTYTGVYQDATGTYNVVNGKAVG